MDGHRPASCRPQREDARMGRQRQRATVGSGCGSDQMVKVAYRNRVRAIKRDMLPSSTAAARGFSLKALLTHVVAPNSLQFNALEFQLSSKEAQEAARDAATRVQPGDLIFSTTSGLVYSVGRAGDRVLA
uniref:Uncharacterized protein n=1 Tax=Hyaloperonospora arabidopsidis (strain Emoy2) TaxID=559515 RepID=M4C498_HYAAE